MNRIPKNTGRQPLSARLYRSFRYWTTDGGVGHVHVPDDYWQNFIGFVVRHFNVNIADFGECDMQFTVAYYQVRLPVLSPEEEVILKKWVALAVNDFE